MCPLSTVLVEGRMFKGLIGISFCPSLTLAMLLSPKTHGIPLPWRGLGIPGKGGNKGVIGRSKAARQSSCRGWSTGLDLIEEYAVTRSGKRVWGGVGLLRPCGSSEPLWSGLSIVLIFPISAGWEWCLSRGIESWSSSDMQWLRRRYCLCAD